jgi:membrane protein YqaA with SNARE-associated domain
MNIFKRIGRSFRKDTLIKKDGTLDVPQLIVSTIILMVIALVLVYAEVRVLRTHAIRQIPFVQKVFDKLGYEGVALAVLLIDTFLVPLSVDMLWPFVMSWPAVDAILLMGIMSGLGGFLGYWIGRLIHKIPFVTKWTESFVQKNDYGKLLQHYGAWGVAMAGLTPIPYSTVCWISGIFQINWKQVLLACFASRLLRMVIYYFFVAVTT